MSSPDSNPLRMLKASLQIRLIAAAGIGLLVALLSIQTSLAQDQPQGTEEYCLSCHSQPDLSITLPNDDPLSLHIQPELWDESVHNQAGIECQACHTEITTYPHPEIDYQSKRELSRSYYLACQKCHEENYNETLDSIHAQMAAAGNEAAPVCTDCHTAHYMQAPDEPRSLISETCGRCHTGVFDVYRGSVHGAALMEEGNPDVPVCTDCHGVHDIPDPRTETFRIESPELCAGCHADPELMSKYGLRADVYDIYSLSWHGVDVAVFKARWPNLWHNSAVCTDCHGIHDILGTENPQSRVHPTNLLATCQQCHPAAGPNWTGAWTGHYQVSLERTPFVFYTEAFYESFTPAVLWISAIYVLLQILRATIERVRRNLP